MYFIKFKFRPIPLLKGELKRVNPLSRFCAFTLILLTLSSSLLALEKLEGFREYKFGMTLNEADSLYNFDKIEEYSYKNIKYNLAYETTIYEEKDRVNILFENDFLFRIDVSFYKPDGGMNDLFTLLTGKLVQLYGDDFIYDEKIGIVRWFFPKGGLLKVMIFKIDEDKGMIIIYYTHSEGL